jgi:predicted dienelactone hydrolase
MSRQARRSTLIRAFGLFAALVTLPIAAPSWARDFSFVTDFERNDALYSNQTPHTIAVRTDLSIVDMQHQRTIPILVRYPSELLNASPMALPVVVWSHGGPPDPNGRNGSREWSETLVRAGFVVVHFSLLARDAAGRQALASELGMTTQQLVACELNPVYVDRPRDASAVISALANIGALVPELQGRLDLTRIVMAGHSFGAYTSRAVAGARLDLCPVGGVMPPGWPYHDIQFRDPRPIAFLALSPQGPGRFSFFERGPTEHSWTTLDRPEFMATGAGDITPAEPPADRLRSWELLAPRSKFMLYIDATDASHATFNLNGDVPTYHNWVASAALAFLDAQVRGDAQAAAWLYSGASSAVSGGVARLSTK